VPQPFERLSGRAPAKVNLVLEVTGRRADGYHEIDTVLQTLELADLVTVESGAAPIIVRGPFAAGTPADPSNLAWRAAEALARLTGQSVEGLSITLEKRIPPAGGLGGGASDAATVLRLLQRRWPEATDELLLRAAAAVGSDEPFFVFGGTARATGRGEIVTPLPPLAPAGVVLFIRHETIERKTARMFEALDRMPFDSGSVAAAFAGRGAGPVTAADVYNSFEKVAFDLFAGLATLWEELERRTGEPIWLAGAGPTLFWVGPPDAAADIAARARGADCTIVETATAGSLWRPS
jgi:4-diphosphocytidyl-2-C-methyl-D-erythritol kinase